MSDRGDVQEWHSRVCGEGRPELFDIRAMPSQPKEKKSGQLPEHMIRKFFEDVYTTVMDTEYKVPFIIYNFKRQGVTGSGKNFAGWLANIQSGYVLVENFFAKDELQPVRDTINEIVDNLAQKLFKAGKVKSLYEDYGFFDRLSKLETDFPGSNILCFKIQSVPKSFRELWANERLLNVIEQLIGPDIEGHPVWNLRTKTPQNEATTVPWHQDNGYFDKNSDDILIPTAWIPLVDTNEVNGCLEVVEGGHRRGKLAMHTCCWGGTWYVELKPEEMEKYLGVDMKKDTRICPVPYGGMLLFNNLIPHRSLPNLSQEVRWSLDLRWQKPGHPNGLFGLKPCVLMQLSKDPNMKIDWDTFNSVNRHVVQTNAVSDFKSKPKEVDDTEFDTTVQGPWMKQWELTHINRHIEKYLQEGGLVNP